MSETAIIALIGVVATLISGLGSAWLTNRSNLQREKLRSEEERQDYVREVVVKTIVAARGFGGAITGISMMLSVQTTKSTFEKALTEMLNTSDSGREFIEHGAELRLRLTEAKLLVSDREIGAALDHVSSRQQAWFTDVITPMKENLSSTEPDVARRMTMWSKYSDSYTAAIQALESTAADRLNPGHVRTTR